MRRSPDFLCLLLPQAPLGVPQQPGHVLQEGVDEPCKKVGAVSGDLYESFECPGVESAGGGSLPLRLEPLRGKLRASIGFLRLNRGIRGIVPATAGFA